MGAGRIYIRLIAFIIILFVISQTQRYINLSSQNILSEEYAAKLKQDLPQILEQGKLIATTEVSSTSYFSKNGEIAGFEYDLLNAYANYIGVELDIKPSNNLDSIFELLNNYSSDVAASNLTITENRKKIINFTFPVNTTKQVIIQRKPKTIKNINELQDKEIWVRKNSSFYERLINIAEETGETIDIKTISGELTMEDLIEMVSKNKIDYTIVDENVAQAIGNFHPNIDWSVSISFPQKIAWAVRKSSPKLLLSLDNWLKSKQGKQLVAIYKSKYFGGNNTNWNKTSNKYYSTKTNEISGYDKLIKKYSNQIGWDWRLMAALIYQESRFNPDAKSLSGAEGLMQLIPTTALLYHNDTNNLTSEENLKVGATHIIALDTYWKNYISDSDERVKFVLASYNAGLGHVIDACSLAEKSKKESTKWSVVSFYLLKKSEPEYYNDKVVKYGYCRGQEPYNYVKQIILRYEHYKNLLNNTVEISMNITKLQ